MHHVCMYLYICTCICMSVNNVSTYICMYVCMYVSMSTCMYVCMYVYMYVLYIGNVIYYNCCHAVRSPRVAARSPCLAWCGGRPRS